MASPKKVPFWKRRWVRYTLLSFVMLVAMGLIGMYVVLRPFIEYADRYDLAVPQEMERATTIYDRDGEEIARIFVKNRRPIKFSQVPKHFIDSLVATEDARFFEHDGIDYRGIARATLLNLKRGGVTQGASTITQQLARNAYDLKVEFHDKNGRERGFDRKLVEMFLAQRIDAKYSKDSILEMYLNHIYFGSGYWGIQSAAQGYFGKDIDNLNTEESATIVGLIKSPENLSPFINPEASKESRNHVFLRLREEGKITPEEWARLRLKPLVLAPRTAVTRKGYVYEEIRQQAAKLIGEGTAIGGYHIYTTIDSKMQAAAEASMLRNLAAVETHSGYDHQTYGQYRQLLKEYLEENQRQPSKGAAASALPSPKVSYLQGAALSIENSSGAVLSMVGGRDFNDSAFNRALQMKRPLGTAFTPVDYTALFSDPTKRYWPGSMVEDTPLDNRRVMIGSTEGILGEWGVESNDVVWQGEITMRKALALSKNGAAVRVGELAGLDSVAKATKDLGFTSELKKLPASYLGASEYSLGEVCLAYSNFPNLGSHPAELHFISKITDYERNEVYRWIKKPAETVSKMDPIAAYQVHSCLNEAMRTGSASKAAADLGLSGFSGGGKTGTYHGQKDLWFVGYDKSITTAVWVGFDAPRTIYPNAYSHEVAMPVWADITKAGFELFPDQPIQPPPNSTKVEICDKSGKLATDRCYEVIPAANASGRSRYIRCTTVEVIRPGTIDSDYCSVHSGQAPHPEQEIENPVPFTPLLQVANPAGDLSPFVVKPVKLKQPTIVGADPFHSKTPQPRAAEAVIAAEDPKDKPPTAVAVDENGNPLPGQPGQPGAVEAAKVIQTELGNAKYRVSLPVPGPISIQ